MLRYFSRSLVLILCPYVAMAEIPSAERWLSHLNDDLLPFFETPLALGTPVGNFPTVRCNDGSIPDPDARCTEVGRNAALDPTQSVVALSRQSFAYGVAFHMTGETRYLEFAQAGVDRLIAKAGCFLTGSKHRTARGPISMRVQTPNDRHMACLRRRFYII
jgi:hypothetical protein